MTCDTIGFAVTKEGNGTLLAGRYHVVRQLGQGGMGSVWLVEDMQLDNKQFAIKMLPSILVSNKRAYRQLKNEALVAMKLTHPNIVTLRAFEENNGNPFLVMDYIDGQTLDDYLSEKGTLAEDETIKILHPIAAALDYAHSKGVVHRDVKPSNVMIAKDGTPYILDFGIAREMQETMANVTGRLSSGTLLYMSPEQLNGDPPLPAQDIYSFAAMAYECLTGRPPFVHGAVEDQIRNKAPAPLVGSGTLNSSLVPSVMSGLAKSPEERPSSCAAVIKRGDSEKVADLLSISQPRRFIGKMFLSVLVILVVIAIGAVWCLVSCQKDAVSLNPSYLYFFEANENSSVSNVPGELNNLIVVTTNDFVVETNTSVDMTNMEVGATVHDSRGTDFPPFAITNMEACATNHEDGVASTRLEEHYDKIEEKSHMAPTNGESRVFSVLGNVCMEMIYIDPTSEDGESINIPGRVMPATPYWISKYPVTQGQWSDLKDTPRERAATADFPMVDVSWSECKLLVDELNNNDRAGMKWSMPTKEQWEFAAFSGEDINDVALSCSIKTKVRYGSKDSPQHSVTTDMVNGIGFVVVRGGFYEWCNDQIEDGGDGHMMPKKKGEFRALCGHDLYGRSEGRSPDSKRRYIGFRLCGSVVEHK